MKRADRKVKNIPALCLTDTTEISQNHCDKLTGC